MRSGIPHTPVGLTLLALDSGHYDKRSDGLASQLSIALPQLPTELLRIVTAYADDASVPFELNRWFTLHVHQVARLSGVPLTTFDATHLPDDHLPPIRFSIYNAHRIFALGERVAPASLSCRMEAEPHLSEGVSRARNGGLLEWSSYRTPIHVCTTPSPCKGH
jgi:hypothetical protein